MTEALSAFKRILILWQDAGATFWPDRVNQAINSQHSSRSGDVEIEFQNDAPYAVYTKNGMFELPTMNFGNRDKFLELLEAEFVIINIPPRRPRAEPTGKLGHLRLMQKPIDYLHLKSIQAPNTSTLCGRKDPGTLFYNFTTPSTIIELEQLEKTSSLEPYPLCPKCKSSLVDAIHNNATFTKLEEIIIEAGGRIPTDLAEMYPAESGKIELHFENGLQRIRTPEGQYLWDASIPRPNQEIFQRLLNQTFQLETLREKLDGHSHEGPVASCLGPIIAISLKPETEEPNLPQFIFVGDDQQLADIESACKDLKLPIVREDRFVGFLAKDELKFKAALLWIFDKRINGWWNQQNALIEHRICSQAQFESAYYGEMAKLESTEARSKSRTEIQPR